jgi:zinc protease
MPGLSPHKTIFDNGVVFLAKSTHTTPAVSVHLAVHSGAITDPHEAPGAMWLLSRVIDRGTAWHSTADIAEALDSRGVSLSVRVSRQLLSLVCTCLAEDFEIVLALLGEMLIAPTFPDDEIAVRKGEVITAIRQDEDNPYVRAADALTALLYPPPHPYARPVKGSVAGVERLTRDTIVRLHADRIVPSRLRVVIVGDVDVKRAEDVANRVFGGWRGGGTAPVDLVSPRRAASRRREVIPMMNKAQADIACGFTSIRRSDPEYYALQLANHVFGQYAMGGRLGDNIRERQGLAYYVSTNFEAESIDGPLSIHAGIAPANVDRALTSIEEELARLTAEGITAKELDDSRRFLIGALPRSLETNTAIASFLQQSDFFGLGLDYDLRQAGLLRAVTVDDANAAARRIMDVDRLTTVIAGPYAEH